MKRNRAYNRLGMIVKKNGVKQRSDLTLTKEIANNLREGVLSGESLYQKGGKIIIFKPSGEEIIIPIGTFNAWVSRRNIVPELGVSLQDYLNEARRERKIRKMKAEQDLMREEGQRGLRYALKLKTRQPVINMFGKYVKDENGNLVEKENHHLLRVKLDASKFALERLHPDYAKKSEVKAQHLVFSLAEFRRQKQEYEEEKEEKENKNELK